jgi:arginine repressor
MATVPTPLFRTKTRDMQLIEQQIGEPLEDALRRLYVAERLEQKAIAARWGVEQSTISRWLRDFGIYRLPQT